MRRPPRPPATELMATLGLAAHAAAGLSAARLRAPLDAAAAPAAIDLREAPTAVSAAAAAAGLLVAAPQAAAFAAARGASLEYMLAFVSHETARCWSDCHYGI